MAKKLNENNIIDQKKNKKVTFDEKTLNYNPESTKNDLKNLKNGKLVEKINKEKKNVN